jgi:hypothetical protein
MRRAERDSFYYDWRIEMAYSVLLVAIVGIIFLIAILGALILIGLVIYRSRKNKRENRSSSANELDPDQAAEITSTWNMLNH